MDIISEQLVTDSEAKEILESVEKGSELKFAQKNALEVLRKFITDSPENVKKFVAELKKIEKLRDRHIISIANFIPKDKDDLRAVLHKEYASFSEDELNLILETVKKFG